MTTQETIKSIYNDINELSNIANKQENKDLYNLLNNLYVSLESKMMNLENEISHDIETVIDYLTANEYSLLEECSRGI